MGTRTKKLNMRQADVLSLAHDRAWVTSRTVRDAGLTLNVKAAQKTIKQLERLGMLVESKSDKEILWAITVGGQFYFDCWLS